MDVERIISGLPGRSSSERQAVRENADRLLASGTADQKAAARCVLDALDDLERAEAATLVEHVRGLPDAQRVVEAFSSPPMTETERAVVQVLLDNPGLTSAELTARLGWRAQAWHMHFGSMCFNRRARLWPAPPAEKRDADFYSGILVDYSPETHGFAMKPEAIEGFRALGIASTV